MRQTTLDEFYRKPGEEMNFKVYKWLINVNCGKEGIRLFFGRSRDEVYGIFTVVEKEGGRYVVDHTKGVIREAWGKSLSREEEIKLREEVIKSISLSEPYTYLLNPEGVKRGRGLRTSDEVKYVVWELNRFFERSGKPFRAAWIGKRVVVVYERENAFAIYRIPEKIVGRFEPQIWHNKEGFGKGGMHIEQLSTYIRKVARTARQKFRSYSAHH